MKFSDIPVMLQHLNRLWFGRFPMATRQDLSEKIMIVTGASPGSIGYETAKTLASWGAAVIVTARSRATNVAEQISLELSEQGTPGIVEGHNLDLSEASSVQTFAQWFTKNYPIGLDCLINNAGIHLDLMSQWKEPTKTADGYEIHWRTNYLGTMHLTHLLLPHLLKTGVSKGEARIVNVVSHLHSKGVNSEFFHPSKPYNSWDAYSQSKLALVHATLELERRFGEQQNLHAYSLHPGSIYTNIAGKGLDGNPVIQAIRNFLAPIERRILLTTEQGAQTQLMCATKPNLEGGRYYERCFLGNINPETKDIAVAVKLWEETVNWTNSKKNQELQASEGATA